MRTSTIALCAATLFATCAGSPVSAQDKGFKDAVSKGSLIGFPVVGVRVVVNDGQFHAVDSSEQAFKTASIMAFREGYAVHRAAKACHTRNLTHFSAAASRYL